MCMLHAILYSYVQVYIYTFKFSHWSSLVHPARLHPDSLLRRKPLGKKRKKKQNWCDSVRVGPEQKQYSWKVT